MEATTIEVDVLGPLRVRVEGEPVVLAERARRLFLALLVRRGDTVAADMLAEAVWPDDPPADARNALQAQVSRLRRALGSAADVLVTEAGGYRLELPSGSVDADRLQAAVREARSHDLTSPSGSTAMGAARRRLAAAIETWRGDPLPEAADDHVATAETTRLRELHLEAIELHAELTLSTGGGIELVATLRPLVEEHPARERLHRALAHALYRGGRQQDALDVLARTQRHLREEHGLDPEPATAKLQEAMLRHDPSLQADGRAVEPAGAHLAEADVAAPHPLPRSRTSFVGREREIAEVTGHLRGSRLVTLTGPGGTGKTRLAVEVADRWVRSGRGQAAMVELASLTDPNDIPLQVASAVGVPVAAPVVAGGSPPPVSPSLQRRIAMHLAGRPLLVILDNCEHLIDGAAAATEQILLAAPTVRVLATSREGLQLPGEVRVTVPPLTLPVADGADGAHKADEAGGGASEAVQLFLDRARSADPDLAVDEADAHAIVELCRRLDGLPLAIELAAARVTTLPVRMLVSRLSDRFELLTGGPRTLQRQRTLGDVVAWSYDLLDARQRRALRRLGVFTTPPTIEVAEAVCADDELPGGEVLPTLAELADRSLLQLATTPHGDTRVRLLETIREFARLRLEDEEDAEVVRDRHARVMAQQAHAAATGLQGAEQLRWLERLDAEHDDLRVAFERLLADDGDLAVTMTCDLAWFWWLRSMSEGRTWLDRAIAAADEHTAKLALARSWVAFLSVFDRCDPEHIGHAVAEAQAALDRLGDGLDAPDLAASLLLVAYVRMTLGEDPEVAWRLLSEATAAAEASGNAWVESAAHFSLAVAAITRGEPDLAARHADRALSLSDVTGDGWSRFQTLQLTSTLHTRRGDYEAAWADLDAAATIAERMGASGQVREIRCQQALSTMLAGDCDGARASLTAVLERSEADGQRSPFALHGLGLVAHRIGDQEEAVAWHRDAAELFLDREERHAAAEALAGIAFARATLADAEAAEAAVGSAVALLPPKPLTTTHPLLLEAAAAAAVAGGDPELGLRRLGRATALRERLGAVLVAGDRFDVDRVELEARRHLEDARAEAAHADGRVTEGLLPPVA